MRSSRPTTTASSRSPTRSRASRRPSSSSRPASWASRSPATSPRPASAAASACCRVYGGRAYEPQVEALQNGVEVVVGTPGRLIDLAQQRHLDLGHVKVLVLDEADEMLDLGFLPDVERIVAQVPAVRQTMLFSATMPGTIVSLARRYMTQPTHIRAIDPHDDGATSRRSSSTCTAPTPWTRTSCSPACCRPTVAA